VHVILKASAQERLGSRTALERGESLDSSLLESHDKAELLSSPTTAPRYRGGYLISISPVKNKNIFYWVFNFEIVINILLVKSKIKDCLA
jgi:hypothetical protein